MAILKTCGVCEKGIFVTPNRLREKNFCSKTCSGINRRTRIKVNCTYCNTVTEKHYYQITLGTKFFCNRGCLNSYQIGSNNPKWVEANKKCKWCKKEIPHKLAVKTEVKFCSRECRYEGMLGENAYNWNGGSSYKFYPKEFTKSLKRTILLRDNSCCRGCGISNEHAKRLHVHHIDMDRKNNSQENLITLCTTCHGKEHRHKQVKTKENFWPYYL